MLVKLMKHEFHATGRVSLPLCGVMLALSVVAGITLRFWDGKENSGWWETAVPIVMMLYSISIFAVAIGIFILLMQHYKRNLLGDEGYLMRTLPVSVHELLLSKLFVALVWYVAAGVLTALSGFLMVVLSGELDRAEFEWMGEMLKQLSVHADFWISAIVGGIGALALLTLMFYADFTLSQAFYKHRFLYHVMGIVIFLLLLRLVGAIDLSFAYPALGIGVIGGADGPTSIYVTGGVPWVRLAEVYLSAAVLYALTWAALKFRPNIE